MTTPSALSNVASRHFLDAQPPLLSQEGNTERLISICSPSAFLLAGLSARGSIVAVGDAEASLRLLRHQAFAAALELVDGDSLDHVSLPRHQGVDTLECFPNAL